MNTIYQPAYLYENGTFVQGRAVLVEEDTIKAVGPSDEIRRRNPGARLERWERMVLVPGCVNVHNHAFQTMLRGLSCDRPFLEWRSNSLYKYSPRFRPEDIYTSALFDFSEMMKCGVTTVSEFFYLHHYGTESDELVIQAARDVGIRLVLARTMYDWDGAPAAYVESIDQAVENTRSLARKYRDDPMVTILPAPHSLHAASPEMVQAGHALAKELGTKFHIHVAEEPFEVEFVKREQGGLTPVEFLDKLGVVDERMVFVHGVWLKESEIDLLGSKGCSLAYCPCSNMFLADGVTDIPHMMRAGVNIGLGCDGACANNRNSIFEEMRMAALLQKLHTLDAVCVNYNDVFRMGTENGARLLDLETGVIAPGKKADFAGLALDDLSMQPMSPSGEQLLPNLVYAMQPTAIRYVVVGGRTTVSDGRFRTLSETYLLEKIRETMEYLRKDD